MKKMIPILLLKLLSCQAPKTDQTNQTVNQIEPTTVSTIEVSESISLSITGDLSQRLLTSSYARINQNRKFPLAIKSPQESDFRIVVRREENSYLLQILKGRELLSQAKAYNDFELPLACASLAGEYIPNQQSE